VEFSEFKQKIDSDNGFSICLFEGEEMFLAEEGLSILKEKFVSYPELDYVRIDGADVTVDELVSHVTAFPFMSQKRVVAVSEFYPNQSFLNSGLKDVFTNPSSDNVFVILNRKSCDTLKKQKNVTVISCKKQDKAPLVKWIIKELKGVLVYGKKIHRL
jgi:DNA polymerase III delta subunit